MHGARSSRYTASVSHSAQDAASDANPEGTQSGRLYCAVYASRPVQDITPFDVLAILEASRRNNAARDVTGVLFCSATLFLQALEGPPAAVNAVFQRISMDPRHRAVALLWYGPIQERRFPSWYMRSVGSEELSNATIDAIERGEFPGQDVLTLVRELSELPSSRWLGDRPVPSE